MTNTQDDLVLIGSYHKELLVDYDKSEFHFFAFNLSTRQTVRVIVHGKQLFLRTCDIQFAPHGGEKESTLVSELQTLIGLNDSTAQKSERSECCKKFRTCLESVLSLYSSCTNQVHDVAFIELTFSISNALELTNNFAGLVPIRCENGALTAMLPFNGCLWEERIKKQEKCFLRSTVIPCTEACDGRVSHLRTVFRDRTMMMSGKAILAPFCIVESGREHRTTTPLDEYMILRQNTETYLMLYGTLVSISRSHSLMTEHEMDMLVVQNVLYTAVSMFGHSTRVSSQSMINNFFSVLCYCMHLGQLGHKCYRKDILGEDIRTRCVSTFHGHVKAMSVP